MLSDEALRDISNNQYYAHQICWSIVHGTLDPDLLLLSWSFVSFKMDDSRSGICKLRPASRNRAACEGVRFFNRMRPAARECFTCFLEIFDKINVTNRAF